MISFSVLDQICSVWGSFVQKIKLSVQFEIGYLDEFEHEKSDVDANFFLFFFFFFFGFIQEISF